MLEQLASFLWGPGTLLLVFGAGIYFTVGLGFRPWTKIKAAFSAVLHQDADAPGEVSGFGALCTSLAATLGTGNIIGVATAVAAGGPGARFWMVVSALFGMGTKYAEGYLAVRYRRPTAGGFCGGPFYYLEQGLKSPALAKVFAFACVVCCLISMGTTSQINGMVDAAEAVFPSPYTPLMAGALTTLLVGLVLKGGIKRIARVSSLLVPLMAALYTGLILWLLIRNIGKIPAALGLILRSAFAPEAVFGGAAGYTLQKAVRFGLGRGIFSNEAGMGSDPIAAAAAKTRSPARQGLISMLGPFLDTVVMCSLTGLGIVVTDAWQIPHLDGADITLYALTRLPLPKDLLSVLYMACLLFFGFSSIIGWSYYGEQSLCYLLPRRPKAKALFRWLFLTFLMAGAFLSADAAWALADIFCAMMLIPNLIGLLGLSKAVFHGTKKEGL